VKTLVFHSASRNLAGDTDIWTPPAGYRFQLMGFTASIGSDAKAAAAILAQLKDGAAAFCDIFVVGANAQSMITNVFFSGDGYISTADDNVLKITLSGNMTTGSVFITVWGYEI
jgi:hypothetical protein